MLRVLALIAAMISTVALLVVVSLTVFVVSLAFRASASRKGTTDLHSSMVGDFRANRPRVRLARDPGAGGDRSARRTT
jgi:hypothetical protein